MQTIFFVDKSREQDQFFNTSSHHKIVIFNRRRSIFSALKNGLGGLPDWIYDLQGIMLDCRDGTNENRGENGIKRGLINSIFN